MQSAMTRTLSTKAITLMSTYSPAADERIYSYDIYSMLKNEICFSRACIPLNNRNVRSTHSAFYQYGNFVCSLDGTQFTCLGKSGGKNRSLRIKWICNKSIQKRNKRICVCKSHCTESSYGKCTYMYPDKDFINCRGLLSPANRPYSYLCMFSEIRQRMFFSSTI